MKWNIKYKNEFKKELSKIKHIKSKFFYPLNSENLRNQDLAEGIKVIFSKQINFGFQYLTEILIIGIKNNFSISEVPITFVNRIRGKSSVNLKIIIEAFLGLLILKIKNF